MANRLIAVVAAAQSDAFRPAETHDIAWPDSLYRAALALDPAAPVMMMSSDRAGACAGRACARLESDESAGNAGGLRRAEERMQADRPGNHQPALCGRL